MEWRRINRALAWEMEPITYIQCCVSSWALYLMDVFALFLDQDKVSQTVMLHSMRACKLNELHKKLNLTDEAFQTASKLSLVFYVIHFTSTHAMQRMTTWELAWLWFHHDYFPIRSKLSQGILISPKVLAWLRGPIIRLTNFDAGSVCGTLPFPKPHGAVFMLRLVARRVPL